MPSSSLAQIMKISAIGEFVILYTISVIETNESTMSLNHVKCKSCPSSWHEFPLNLGQSRGLVQSIQKHQQSLQLRV